MNVRWHDFLADPFDEIRSRLNDFSGLFISFENRAVRIGSDDANPRILFLEKATGAGDRAARAETGDEVRYPAFSLAPQLGTGSAIMRCWICLSRILIGIKRVRSF